VANKSKISAARKKGDSALEKAGIERQGGTGLSKNKEGEIVVSFGVMMGEGANAAAVLNELNLEVPYEVRERGPIKAL
jgi:hypothetical protein